MNEDIRVYGSAVSSTSPLVGRAGEKSEIVGLLHRPEVRLVTLVGPPGSGKTRLALLVAQELVPELVHGAVFVDLVPVQQSEMVIQAVAAAVGIRDMGGRELDETLVAVLRDQELLLVLDNFEHVMGAAALVARLLTSCPRLTVLATSRTALGLGAEHQYRVPPLAVPRAEDMADLQTLAGVPSVALFCLRATAVKHDWVLDTAHAPAVGELCRRLDGLPLAIELAAAWTNVLSPQAVLARLDTALDERSVEQVDRPARHRSLRDAIAWSYDLLSQQERAVFERIAVFVGGWTLAAADAVCGGPGLEVLEVLARLVNKHLVTSIEQPDGEPRFDMLVTLRAYARSRLISSGDEADARGRHALFFVELAEQAERALTGPGQREWLDRLEQEYDNLRAALAWAVDAGDLQIALRLSGALWFFWDMRGHLREGRDWLDRLHAHPASQVPTATRVGALNAAGWLALVGGEYDIAVEFHESALNMARQLDEAHGIMRSAMHLGLALGLGPQDFDRALALYDEALPIARTRGDVWTVGLALYGQGHIAALRGALDEVDRIWNECYTVCAAVQSLYALSYLQFRWGILALQAGALDRAQSCLAEALRYGDEVDSAREMGVAMDALGWVAAGKKEMERAAGLFGAAQALLDRAGYNLPPFMAPAHERAMAATQSVLGTTFQVAWDTGRQLSRSQAIAVARGDMHPRRARDYAPLTKREWEVASLVAQGNTNRQIAAALNIADRTAIAHLEHIFAKLRVKTRAQVAVWVTGRAEQAVPVLAEGPALRLVR